MGSLFRELAPKDLHAHLRYIASGHLATNRAELFFGESAIGIPVVRKTFMSKRDRIGLLLRSSSLGRAALDQAFEELNRRGQALSVRRSTKLKLVSQCLPYWPVSDATYPAQAVAILRLVCAILAMNWPLNMTLVYVEPNVDGSLPGTLDRGAAWRTGRALGRITNRIIGGN